ncbi:hypothetical protein ABIB25_001948 [Nakamurella sp. UYEF19]|uniref:PLD nuclease N-terminal domain-containing protein n=1 Tax=Nakamurella sp. UYEF19 TaxID=1756392 RepID=UPI00339642FC
MLYLDGVIGLALLALWVFCLVDVIGTPADATRNLPKLLWLVLVIFLSWVGCLLWFLCGRPRAGQVAATGFYEGAKPQGFPEYERLGRSTAGDSEADLEFLRQCRERADQQRASYLKKRQDEQD